MDIIYESDQTDRGSSYNNDIEVASTLQMEFVA